MWGNGYNSKSDLHNLSQCLLSMKLQTTSLTKDNISEVLGYKKVLRGNWYTWKIYSAILLARQFLCIPIFEHTKHLWKKIWISKKSICSQGRELFPFWVDLFWLGQQKCFWESCLACKIINSQFTVK